MRHVEQANCTAKYQGAASCPTKMGQAARFVVLTLLLLLVTQAPAWGEDTSRFRPYFRFSNGDISSNWNVYDMWNFALGANLDRHWGGELGIDFYERNFNYQGKLLGEVGGWHLVPQARLRWPLLDDRLVPYLIGGAGVSFLQFNDATEAATGRQVHIDGSTFAMVGGGGIDYFVSDNVALSTEGKYFWLQPLRGRVDGRGIDVDLSSPTLTVGIRVYTDENHPRALADAGTKSVSRGYFGVRFGGAVLTDDRWVPGVKLAPEGSSFGAINQTGGLLFGWDFDRHWGAELAVDSHEFRVNVDGLNNIGEYGMGVAIAQVRYRMPMAGGRWVPYLNAGMGMAFSEFNDSNDRALKVHAKGGYPACSVGGGVEYFLLRNLSLLADLGWLYSWNHSIGVDNFISSGRGDLSALTSHLGFRVYFFD